MLSGGYGEGMRRAMEIQVRQGEFYDAESMVSISMAYLVTGPDPSHRLANFLKELADQGARFRCPATLVPAPEGSVPGSGSMQLDPELHRKLGGVFAYGGGFGHARNAFMLPIFGQNIVSDGTAVTSYFNGVIGARANNMDAIGQYTSAMVGCAPKYGYLTREGRLGKVLVEVQNVPTNDTDWSVLGYYVGWQLGRHWWDVPVFSGVQPSQVSTDDLVMFCTSLPAYGAVNHFLMVGISPEARTIEEAFGGQPPKEKIVVGPTEMRKVYERFSTSAKKPDLVCIGGFGVDTSITNLYKIAETVRGKKVSKDFPTVVLMNPIVKAAADRAGITATLEAAGMQTSMESMGKEFNPVTDSHKAGIKVAVFNNAKSCHYIGQQQLDAVLMNLDDTLAVALTGKMGGS